MEASYLKKVLNDGLGMAFSKDTQPVPGHGNYSFGAKSQKPLQNHFPFSTMLWNNENGLKEVEQEIVFDQLVKIPFPTVRPVTMNVQKLEVEQKFESKHYLPKSTPNASAEMKAPPLSQDKPFTGQKKAGLDLHITTESKLIGSDIKRKGRKPKEDGFPEAEDTVDAQKSDVRRVQPEDRNRIPVIEVVKRDAIPKLDQSSSSSPTTRLVRLNAPFQQLSSQKQVEQSKVSAQQKEESPQLLQSQSRESKTAEVQQEKRQDLPYTSDQGQINESDTPVRIIKVAQKPPGQLVTESSKERENRIIRGNSKKKGSLRPLQSEYRLTRTIESQKEETQFPSDITEMEKMNRSDNLAKVVEVIQKPVSRQNLHTHWLTEFLKGSETQILEIARDIALLNRKLDEHIQNENPENKPVFLCKRPASQNLAGWSILERNYIR